MTKTITQLQPFIYEVILSESRHPRRMLERRRQTLRLLRGITAAFYVILGLRVTADTGLAPWNAGFWAIIVPLYVLGEWTLREVSRWLLPSS